MTGLFYVPYLLAPLSVQVRRGGSWGLVARLGALVNVVLRPADVFGVKNLDDLDDLDPFGAASAQRARSRALDAMTDADVDRVLAAYSAPMSPAESIAVARRARAARRGPAEVLASAPGVRLVRPPGSGSQLLRLEVDVPAELEDAVPALSAALGHVEALLGHYARRLAERGSWADVGRVLGVSRQAAHRRFGSAA